MVAIHMKTKCNCPDCTFPDCTCWDNKKISDNELIELLTGHKQLDDFCGTEERVQWQSVIDTVREYDKDHKRNESDGQP